MPERVRARTGGKRRSPAVTPRTPRTASDLGTGRLTRCVKRPSKQRVVQLAGAAARVTDSLGLRRTQARRLGKRVGDSSRSRPARERPSDELSDNRHRQRRTPVDGMDGLPQATRAAALAPRAATWLRDERPVVRFVRLVTALSGPLAAEFSRTRIKAAPDGAAGPAPASRALPWEARPGRTPGHTSAGLADEDGSTDTDRLQRGAVFLAPHRPARGRRVKGAYGVAARRPLTRRPLPRIRRLRGKQGNGGGCQ